MEKEEEKNKLFLTFRRRAKRCWCHGYIMKTKLCLPFQLGVMQKYHKTLFEPHLPKSKVDALLSLNPGRVSKYMFDWKDPWWLPGDSNPPIMLADPNENVAPWIQGMSCFRPPGRACSMAMCFISGDWAIEVDKRSENQVKSNISFQIYITRGQGELRFSR